MRSRIVAVSIAVVLLPVVTGAAAPARGQSSSGGVSLTVYSQDLAVVRTMLDRVLEPGIHAVEVDGLPPSFDPSSLLVVDPGVVLLGARDFRTYQGPTTGPGAAITLDVEVAARVSSLSLVFLSRGMGWNASYSMVVAADDASARVDGYASVVNNSGTRYENALVQLLAGTINRQGALNDSFRYELDAVRAMAESRAGSWEISEASFGDYHLYTVDEPLSLSPGESRRIRMWGAESVGTRKEYVLASRFNYHQQYPEPVSQPVTARYRVTRPEGTDFGDVPLPAGQVRMFQPDASGRLQLLGIAAIDNTPREQDLLLNVGHAFDIVGTRTQTDYSRPGGNRTESEWRVELTNETDEDVVVQVVEGLAGDWTVLHSTHDAEKLSAGAILFRVPVPAGGDAVLEYRVSVRS